MHLSPDNNSSIGLMNYYEALLSMYLNIHGIYDLTSSFEGLENISELCVMIFILFSSCTQDTDLVLHSLNLPEVKGTLNA